MADALVELLNSLGYQPVFLPRTGVVPPELYNLANGRLVRRGPLKDYLPAVASLLPTEGQLANIAYRKTTKKRLKGATAFLERALKCIGIASVPKLDLSFAATSELSFAFADVSYASVDPSRLDPLLKDLATGAIPAAYVEEGLHIAYEYMYARRLLMSRADGSSFDEDISGKIGGFVDLGVAGSVSVESTTTISFESHDRRSVAFAYKAGRLEQENGKWSFYPEEVLRGIEGDTSLPYVIEPGRVLELDEGA